jgi:hypothetical protein
MTQLSITGDIANPQRMSFRVPASQFVGPPRYEGGRFLGPNRDMDRLVRDLKDLLGQGIVVEYGRDPANSHMAYVAITLPKRSAWDDSNKAAAGQLIAQA